MMLQHEAHSCPELKDACGRAVVIERVSMDRKCSEWEWKRIDGDRSHVNEHREFIAFCPYCGKELK